MSDVAFDRGFRAGIEAAAKVVETLPGKVMRTTDGYGTWFEPELCEPTRHNFAKTIRALEPVALTAGTQDEGGKS